MNSTRNLRLFLLLSAVMVAACVRGWLEPRVIGQTAPAIVIPMAWNDRELADWSTPLRGLGLRPGFYSEAEFAKIPPQTLYRSYPAYHPESVVSVSQ